MPFPPLRCLLLPVRLAGSRPVARGLTTAHSGSCLGRMGRESSEQWEWVRDPSRVVVSDNPSICIGLLVCSSPRTRSGDVVRLVELLDEAKSRCIENITSRKVETGEEVCDFVEGVSRVLPNGIPF